MPETSGAPPERVPAGSRLSLKAILAGAAESIDLSALGATSQASVSSATAVTGPSMRISQKDLILLTSIEEGGCPNRGVVAAFHLQRHTDEHCSPGPGAGRGGQPDAATVLRAPGGGRGYC